MKIIRVYKDLELTNELRYSTEEEIQFFHDQEELGTFGINYTTEISDYDIEQDKINQESLKYLAETDFYVIRQIDSGKEMPNEIKQLRQEARDKIVKL